MKNTLATRWLTLTHLPFDPEVRSEALHDDNPYACEVAQPLFNSGVGAAAITCRHNYRSQRLYFPECHEIRLLLQGKQTVQHNDTVTPMVPGDLSYCPPDCKLRYDSEKDTTTRWLDFKINDIPEWELLNSRGPYVEAYESADLMFVLLRRVLDAHKSRRLEARPTALSDSNMLLRLLRRLTHQRKVPDERILALRELVDDISRNPVATWQQADMARKICVSPRTLLRLFHSEYGCTPLEMVVRQRMSLAMSLLSGTEESVETIAFKCGYDNASSFNRAFCKRIGTPPGRFRRTSKGDLL